MSQSSEASSSRRSFLALGLKTLAVALPVALVLGAKPNRAEAAYRRRRYRRRWW